MSERQFPAKLSVNPSVEETSALAFRSQSETTEAYYDNRKNQ